MFCEYVTSTDVYVLWVCYKYRSVCSVGMLQVQKCMFCGYVTSTEVYVLWVCYKYRSVCSMGMLQVQYDARPPDYTVYCLVNAISDIVRVVHLDRHCSIVQKCYLKQSSVVSSDTL